MDAHYKTIEKIQENETYKQILKDSFGGVMYQEGKQQDYDSSEILKLWNSLPTTYQEVSGGIMKGVFDFLKS